MITIKAGTKAANKKEAYELVQRLAKHETLLEHEIHGLLLYFAPPAKPAKSQFNWIASFVGVKDCREGLNYVYSDGLRIMATNGHILAWCPSELPKGYYCPKTGNVVEGVDYAYPDIDRVIPSIPDNAETVALDKLPVQQESEESSVLVVRVPVAPYAADDAFKAGLPNNACLLADYVKKAMAGGTADVYLPSDTNKPVRGVCEYGSFVIMPRRQ